MTRDFDLGASVEEGCDAIGADGARIVPSREPRQQTARKPLGVDRLSGWRPTGPGVIWLACCFVCVAFWAMVCVAAVGAAHW